MVIRALNLEKLGQNPPQAQVEHLLPHQYITREWIGCPDTKQGQGGARMQAFLSQNTLSQNSCEYSDLKFPRAKARISKLAIMTALFCSLCRVRIGIFMRRVWTWFPSTSLFMLPLVAFFVAFTCSGSGPTQEDSPIKYKVLVHERRDDGRSNMLTEHSVNF